MACVDTAVTPILEALRSCAAANLGACRRPVCRFPIVFNGGHPPADACTCTCPDGDGQAWVRMVSLNRAASTTNVAQCFNQIYDLTVELGLYRCAPTPQGNQAAVPERTETEHAHGMLLDAYALRAAGLCCDYFTAHDLNPILVHESAIGPSGGCVGVEVQLLIQGVSDSACPTHIAAAGGHR